MNLGWNLLGKFIICLEMHWLIKYIRTLLTNVVSWLVALCLYLHPCWLDKWFVAHNSWLFFSLVATESSLEVRNQNVTVVIFPFFYIFFWANIGVLPFFFEWFFLVFTLFADISSRCLFGLLVAVFVRILWIGSEDSGSVLWTTIETVTMDLFSLKEKRAHEGVYLIIIIYHSNKKCNYLPKLILYPSLKFQFISFLFSTLINFRGLSYALITICFCFFKQFCEGTSCQKKCWIVLKRIYLNV